MQRAWRRRECQRAGKWKKPLLLSWHFPQFDLAAGYAVWAPTGDFSPTRPDLLAKGFWSHMITLGATWWQ